MPQPVKSKRIIHKEKKNSAPLNVVGGAKPTGDLQTVIGTGIFGLPGQDDGIFSQDVEPIAADGVFFNPYAVTNIDYEQPSSSWVLERRPGQPLYPGATGRGLVLIGPSMGDDGEGTVTVPKWKMLAWMGLGAVGAYFLYKKAVERLEEV